jgi:hypothetical protein
VAACPPACLHMTLSRHWSGRTAAVRRLLYCRAIVRDKAALENGLHSLIQNNSGLVQGPTGRSVAMLNPWQTGAVIFGGEPEGRLH